MIKKARIKANVFEARKTLLLCASIKTLGGQKKMKSEGGYLPCGRRPVSQTGGDITTNYRTKVNECSSFFLI